jgi:hypothetical protein
MHLHKNLAPNESKIAIAETMPQQCRYRFILACPKNGFQMAVIHHEAMDTREGRDFQD